ncbi:neuronal acetylcholine receptor subunit alpha-7-like isoform X1 [Branchiostoma lanceolatum]|uniref:neuronal acetylcholine receptor subunit alpha-7-like isoform X1 n=1 Tax=Branchiostoma lanceolatum TaxID=7740 RepID=UPI0034517E45
MRLVFGILLYTLVLQVWWISGVLCTSDSSRLRKDLLEFYDKSARPVKNDASLVTVEFDIGLRQILDLNEQDEILQTLVWMRLYWKDEFLTWNSSDYGGLHKTSIPSSEIWRPDIFLLNTVDSRTRGSLQTVTDITVTSDGTVSWRQPDILKSSCGVDVSDFPFDQQTCKLEFASWIYYADELDVTTRSDDIDISAYQESDQYALTSATARRNVTTYKCCPHQFPSVVLTLRLKRLHLFYLVNMVVPCIDLLILNIVAFFIPPDTGERLGFTITILLALVVFQQILTQQLPATSRATPLLGQYFTSTIVIVTISILATILVIRLTHPSPPSRPLPRWLHLVLLKYVATLLCMSDIVKSQGLTFQKQGRKPPPSEVAGVEMRVTAGSNNDHQSLYPGSPQSNRYLQRILGHIREIATSLSNAELEEEQHDDWKMAALVLDRVALVLTIIASVAVSLGLLL